MVVRALVILSAVTSVFAGMLYVLLIWQFDKVERLEAKLDGCIATGEIFKDDIEIDEEAGGVAAGDPPPDWLR